MKKMDNQLEIGKTYSLPWNSKGILRKIKNIPWGFKYVVEITETNCPFFEVGKMNASNMSSFK
jgi:hypothetical protein